jgi:glucose-6-phosphate dehydrogenase assembly protein OpcA
MMMNESDSPKPEERRPFQFSLRTLLIAVLVLGVFFGWLASRLQRAAGHRQAAADVRKTEAEIRRLGGDTDVAGFPTVEPAHRVGERQAMRRSNK